MVEPALPAPVLADVPPGGGGGGTTRNGKSRRLVASRLSSGNKEIPFLAVKSGRERRMCSFKPVLMQALRAPVLVGLPGVRRTGGAPPSDPVLLLSTDTPEHRPVFTFRRSLWVNWVSACTRSERGGVNLVYFVAPVAQREVWWWSCRILLGV